MSRTKVLIGALTLLLSAPAVGAAQSDLKVAYVDTQEIIQQAPGYEEANQAFNQTAASWRDTLEQKRTRLQTMFEEYKKQEVILSPEKKTEKQQEMLQLERETQEYFQEKFGPEGAAAAKQAELMQPIIERVNGAIEQVRRDQGYALIFDLNDGALVAGDPDLNITDQVVDRLSRQTSAAPSR